MFDEIGRQLPVTTAGKYRYRENGSFAIECPPGTPLSLTAAFDDLARKIVMDESG